MSVRRKSWIAIAVGLTLLAIAVLTVAMLRRSASPTLVAPSVQAVEAPQAVDAQLADEAPFLVLVWIESVPPDAAVVRAADGLVLGRTPDTIEFPQSSQPVLVRIEREGFIPATRELSVAWDGSLSVVLEPIGKPHSPTTRKSHQTKEPSK